MNARLDEALCTDRMRFPCRVQRYHARTYRPYPTEATRELLCGITPRYVGMRGQERVFDATEKLFETLLY